MAKRCVAERDDEKYDLVLGTTEGMIWTSPQASAVRRTEVPFVWSRLSASLRTRPQTASTHARDREGIPRQGCGPGAELHPNLAR
jgi:hypothetical protein